MLRDFWTGEALSYGECADSTNAIHLNLDDSGSAELQKMSTGSYTISCSAPSYYDNSAKVQIGKYAVTTTVYLARMGREFWYPDQEERKAKIGRVNGNFQIPSNLRLKAEPFGNLRPTTILTDTSAKFLYVWKSRQFPKINRGITNKLIAKDNIWEIRIDSLPNNSVQNDSIQDYSVQDELTLQVYAHFGIHEDFLVDSLTMPVVWIKNQKPILKVEINTPTIKFGCAENSTDFIFYYQASDPDGFEKNCKEIHFYNSDSTSSLGFVDEVYPCYLDRGKKTYPLKNIFSPGQGQGLDLNLIKTNFLKITVFDENRDSTDTTLSFPTSHTILPWNSVELVNSQPIHFKGKEETFHFKAKSSYGQLSQLVVNWGDNSPLLKWDVSFPASDTLDLFFKHKFSDTGSFQISSTIVDACGGSTTKKLRPLLLIQDNAKPSLVVNVLPYQMIDTLSYFAINYIASDRDLESGQDSLFLKVNWGDGSAEPPILIKSKNADSPKSLLHHYPKRTSTGNFSLGIQLSDANGGSADTLILVPQ